MLHLHESLFTQLGQKLPLASHRFRLTAKIYPMLFPQNYRHSMGYDDCMAEPILNGRRVYT